MNDPHLSLLSILGICLILVITFFIINRATKKSFSVREIIAAVVGGIALAVASLLIKYRTISGTIELERQGWPHQYLQQHLREIIDNVELHGILLDTGPLGSYFLINVIFYFCIILFIFSIWRFVAYLR